MIFKTNKDIFRITIELLENINEKYLYQALDRTLKTFKSFKKKESNNIIKKDLEINETEVIIHKNITHKKNKINSKSNNYHLIKVAYENNIITIDFSYLLTDAYGAKLFVQEIVYNYLRLVHHQLKPQPKLQLTSTTIKTKNNTNIHSKVYKIEGKKLPQNNVNTYEFFIDKKETTTSISIISLIIYSILKTKPIEKTNSVIVGLPINLRTKNELNNISYQSIIPVINIENSFSIDEITSLITKEYKNIENNEYTISKNITTTIYNLETINLNEEYNQYVKNIFFTLMPTSKEHFRCGLTTYKNRIYISFSSDITDVSFISNFKKILEDNNINHDIKSNNNDFIKFD